MSSLKNNTPATVRSSLRNFMEGTADSFGAQARRLVWLGIGIRVGLAIENRIYKFKQSR